MVKDKNLKTTIKKVKIVSSNEARVVKIFFACSELNVSNFLIKYSKYLFHKKSWKIMAKGER